MEESQRSPDFCQSNYGMARWQPVNAGKVTVELRYDYGTSRYLLMQPTGTSFWKYLFDFGQFRIDAQPFMAIF